MSKRAFFGASVLAGLVAVAGCAPSVQVTSWNPPEFDVRGIERIAVLDFEGPDDSGKIASAELSAQLWSNQHFQLVNKSELATVVPAGYVPGSTNTAAARQAASWLGIDALLTGRVISYYVSDDVYSSQRIEVINSSEVDHEHDTSHQQTGFGFENNETVNREAAVALQFELVDVRSGHVIAADRSSHNFTGQMTNGEGILPGRESILRQLMDRCVQDTIRRIAPHETTASVPLAAPMLGKGAKDVRRGNSMAQRGSWDAAIQYWETALHRDPESHEALHNLAVAHEVRQDYFRAEQLMQQAVEFESLYNTALQRIQNAHQRFRLVQAHKQPPARQLNPPTRPETLIPPRQEPPRSF